MRRVSARSRRRILSSVHGSDTVETVRMPPPYPWRTWSSVITRVPEGYRVVGEGVYQDGTKRHYEYTWRFDGAPSPMTGAEPGATYSWKRINDHTYEIERRAADGYLVLTSRSVISPDGKLRAGFNTFWDARGQAASHAMEVMYKR